MRQSRAAPAAVVVVAAAVVTAHGLTEVAAAARVPESLAWAYPVITDGLALVAYMATSRLVGAGRRYAWTVVVVAAGVSGLAQAAYLASGALPEAPTWLRAGVGAWPAIAAAVAAHLLHLLVDDDTASPSVVIPAEEAPAVPPLPVPTDVSEAPKEPLPSPTAEVAHSTDVDARVRELSSLLAAGCDVTGAQAAAIHEVSERTGRRLLADARTYLEQHPTNHRLGLHLVEPVNAGGTA